MKKTDTFVSRRQDADAAKNRRLEMFKANSAQNSPAVLERAASRKAQSEGQAERNAAKAEATEVTRQAELIAAAQVKIAEDEQRLKASEEAEASRKAKRDARYANRKAGKTES
jgi:hypothetical protein